MAKRRIDFSNPRVTAEVINTLIARTPVAMMILDRELRVHFVNDHLVRLRRTDRDSVLGTFCYNLSNDGVPCARCAVRDAIEKGARANVTRKDILPDGTVCYLDDYAVPLLGKDGTFDYILEMLINRTSEMTLREHNNKVFVGIIETLVSMLDKKDAYTSTHSHDVTEVSVKLGWHIGLDEEERFELRLASLLHDIGKIYIPDGIINKQSRLTDEEYRIIQRHPAETMNILDNLTQFAHIRDMAGHHHERWDGKGYPDRLKGEEIPLGARIIALADTYDAMTSTRSYRKALPHLDALEEIKRNAGTQFDPELAEQFLQLAQFIYDDRESFISEDETNELLRRHTKLAVERQLVATDKKNTRIIHEQAIRRFFSDDLFAKAIVSNSPAYYRIVDEDNGIIFASDNLARALDLSAGELRDGSRRSSARARTPSDGGDGPGQSPVELAFQTGVEHEGKTTETFHGQEAYCDVHAIPLELVDTDGSPLRCVMEILLDRTKEVRERYAMKNDVKTLLDMLFRLISDMDATTTKGSDDIIQECESFGEYLSQMHKMMRRLTGGTRREQKNPA